MSRFGPWCAVLVALSVPLRAAAAGACGVPGACRINGPILYVAAGAEPGSCGTSWDDALGDLQTALCLASEHAAQVTELWVAAGTYRPTLPAEPPDPRTATFQLRNGLAIYGGFDGTEATLEQRAGLFEQTILSGDLNADDDPAEFPGGPTYSDNSYHVVCGTGTDVTAVLDGFTITAGNANEIFPHDRAGGMTNDNGAPSVARCRFIRNSAIDIGGAMYNRNLPAQVTECVFIDNFSGLLGGALANISTNAVVSDCLFSGNFAGLHGGAVTNEGLGSPLLSGCEFLANTAASKGGAAFSNGSNPTLLNCRFTGNSAGAGGGVFANTSSASVLNCAFSGNEATAQGGGMVQMLGSSLVAGSTFSGNTAGGNGGGLFNSNGGTPTVMNCIFWNNSDNQGADIDESAQIHVASGEAVVGFTLLQGLVPGGSFDGGGNIDGDPLFEDADGRDGVAGTADDDVRLHACSPAIDRGANGAVPDGVETDLDGNPRIVDGNGDGTELVDMGAVEFQAEQVCCAADITADGAVDAADLAVLLGNWGSNPDPAADLNGDGVADAFDLAALLASWGPCMP